MSVFSQQFWREYWISLRRSKRDPRDRKRVLIMTASLVWFIGYYSYVLWSVRAGFDRGTKAIFAIFAFFIIAGFLLRWGSNKLEEKNADKSAEKDVDMAIKKRLSSDCIALAALIVRAGSEWTMRTKELPSQIQVVTRRHLIQVLQEMSVWQDMPAHSRRMLLVADGHWTDKDVLYGFSAGETLQCLRWTLCIDDELPELSRRAKGNHAQAEFVLKRAQLLLNQRRMLAPWDLRVERNESAAFFTRCYAEIVGRGGIDEPDSASADLLSQVYEESKDPEYRDLLVGVDTIRELPLEHLRYAANRAYSRNRCLDIFVDLTNGVDRWEEWIAFCFPEAEILPEEVQIAHIEVT